MATNTAPLSSYQKLTKLLAEKPVILQLLKFAAIGSLNTALDFIILNYLTKSAGITSGLSLGLINIIGFSAATIQSYIWNRAWTFASSIASPIINAFRLILVGGLGFITFVAVFFGGLSSVSENYYLFILVVFLFAEILIWFGFKLSLKGSGQDKQIGHEFGAFVMISIVGGLINSSIVAGASYALAPNLANLINVDTIKNISKILATAVSLIWNFIGYKLFVFRK